MNNIKKLIADHLAQHAAGAVVSDQNRACCYFASVARPAVISHLEAAGFKKISGYYSHRHARQVSYMMMRPTSKGEWADGKAAFPRRTRKKP
jgi:hypothetical protein